MKFGKVPETQISNIDFSLPAEPAFNATILPGKPVQTPKVYIGCAKWGVPEWIGKIYPTQVKEKDFLEHYVKHYNTIELNATHYKVYDEATIQKWADKVGNKDFIFCPKMYKGISHEGNLLDKKELTDEFLKNITAFKNHLGPIFIQLNETFSPGRKNELFTFLGSLPKIFQFFVEVRHPDWFSNAAIKNELFAVLKNLNIGAVITDTSGRRDCVHMHLTNSQTFIRYVSNCLHETDYVRIDGWIERIKFWVQNGLQEIYFFIHMEDEIFSPELTVYVVDKLNAALGLQLEKPKFIAVQPGLFG
ncbi:MAG: DUF72 domain-containing protein [Chitinophagaceae bacterium]|nr:DUF72 domain-containing protein [Chitinophagaceae bacterium]